MLWLTFARPILILYRLSCHENGRMAPVGQTSPQAVHFSAHGPMLGTSSGVQIPSRPVSSMAGCSAFVGQTFMHSAQRVQADRNSASGSAPGGRIALLFFG